jgi:hypothetical protein
MDKHPLPHWGRASHDLLDRWPKDSADELESPAFLTDLPDTGGIADMTVAQLEAYGIPVLKKYDGESSLGHVVLGFSGYGVSLYVPASRLEEARGLIETAQPLSDDTPESGEE